MSLNCTLMRNWGTGVLIKRGFYDHISTTKIMFMFICLPPVMSGSLSTKRNGDFEILTQRQARIKQFIK